MTETPQFETPAEAVAYLVARDPRFAVGRARVRGVDYPVFANAPATLREMMQRAAERHPPDADFVVYEGDRLTYPAFCEQMNRVAHALVAGGVRRGDRIAIAMRNYPELLLAMMAAACIGAVAVPLNGWWTADELEYAFADCGARIVFADGPRAARIAGFADRLGIRVIGVRDGAEGSAETFEEFISAQPTAWPENPVDPDDDFAVMYSSGSTGHPKGVVLTHRGSINAVMTWVLGSAAAKMVADSSSGMPAQESRPVGLVCTPLFHVTATHPIWLQSIALGAGLVLMYKWDAEEAVRLIDGEGVTRLVGVPTQTFDLLHAAERLGSSLETLQFVGSGGAKRPPAQVGELATAFPGKVVATGWGMTETCAVGIGYSGPDYVARPDAAGRLQPPLQEMEIRDEAGRALPDGEIGEIVVKSVCNMRCYLNQPEETVKVLKDGWLSTGDLAWRDADGIYTIVDRKKSIIIRGGENIATLEVEEAIHRHPCVHEVGVFPVPDDRLGETVGAGIALRERRSLDRESLREFLSASLAPFKIPEHIWFFDAPLPRGGTDKIDRRALRAQCLASME